MTRRVAAIPTNGVPVTRPTLPHGSRRCLCRWCDQFFSTVANFDKHRKGGVCNSPVTVGLVCKKGVWVGKGSGYTQKFVSAVTAEALVTNP